MARRTRLSRGRVRTVTRRKTSSRAGTLGGTNSDFRYVYRKKTMPRRKKRRWVSFVRKVNAAAEKELGSRTVLFNDQINSSSATVGQQGCLTLALYAQYNGTQGWLNDLRTIAGLENVGNPTAAAGETTDASTKFMFQSAVMDITLRNVSTLQTDAGGTRQLDAAAALELDIYEIQVRKQSATATAVSVDLSQMLNSFDTSQIGGTGTGISIQDRGASPWEMTTGLSNFGLKVLSKTKYFIPNGQTITHQIRDPSRHVWAKSQLDSFDDWADKKTTRVLYIIYKLVPGLLVGSTVNTYQQAIVVGSTRKYLYKIEGMNDSRERLLGSSYAPANPS